MNPNEPVVPLLELADFPEDCREAAEKIASRSGRISNSQRATAHAGQLAATTRSFLEQTWHQGSLSRELRALIRYKVSNANFCRYCTAHQIGYLKKFGLSEDQLKSLQHLGDSEAFDRKEIAAMNFAEALANDASNIPEEITTEFQTCYTPKERVEITIVASAMSMLNKINDSLNVPLEDDFLEFSDLLPDRQDRQRNPQELL